MREIVTYDTTASHTAMLLSPPPQIIAFRQQIIFTGGFATLDRVWKLFGRGKKGSTGGGGLTGRKGRVPRAPRSPDGTIRAEDRAYLTAWAAERAMVEAYIEPETLVNEMSVVLVDETGDWTRRRIGGPKGIADVQHLLAVPTFFVEDAGYPQRMRDRIEHDTKMRKREEQAQRRKERAAQRLLSELETELNSDFDDKPEN